MAYTALAASQHRNEAGTFTVLSTLEDLDSMLAGFCLIARLKSLLCFQRCLNSLLRRLPHGQSTRSACLATARPVHDSAEITPSKVRISMEPGACRRYDWQRRWATLCPT